MSEPLPDPAAAERARLMDRDYIADRCTVISETHGEKWRIVAMGPRMIKGKVQLVNFVKEYDSQEAMIKDLPTMLSGFYKME